MKNLAKLMVAAAALLAGPSLGSGRQVCEPGWLKGEGVPGTNGDVLELTTFDPDGTGPQPAQLIAGGVFTIAGTVQANNIARWDGSMWQPLGAGMNYGVAALTTFDPDDAGPQPPQLIAAGDYRSGVDGQANTFLVSRWDGSAWQPLGTGMDSEIRALTSFDADGTGPQPPQLIAGGLFTTADGAAVNYVARWDGSAWQPLGAGLDNFVDALAAFDPDGAGPQPPQLIAGGSFTSAGGVSANCIARWDGVAWQALGSGMNGDVADVSSLATFDPDGAGPQPPQLIAGGSFTSAGGVAAINAARWDGFTWQPLGTGMNAKVIALTTIGADGTGPQPHQLIAGGIFTLADGTAANYVARWDGVAWHALGTGVSYWVLALTTFDADSIGPRPPSLIAGGYFSNAGESDVTHVAGWGGSEWHALGTGGGVMSNPSRHLTPTAPARSRRS